MAITSVGASNNTQISALLQQKPESQEVHKVGRDSGNDNDSDNGKATARPTTPSVNTHGQTVGTIINTVA